KLVKQGRCTNAQAARMLDDRKPEGEGGFHHAMRNGQAATVSAHLESLAKRQQCFEPEDLTRILLASFDGIPGIAVVGNEDAQTVAAYREGLMRFDAAIRQALARELSTWLQANGNHPAASRVSGLILQIATAAATGSATTTTGATTTATTTTAP